MKAKILLETTESSMHLIAKEFGTPIFVRKNKILNLISDVVRVKANLLYQEIELNGNFHCDNLTVEKVKVYGLLGKTSNSIKTNLLLTKDIKLYTTLPVLSVGNKVIISFSNLQFTSKNQRVLDLDDIPKDKSSLINFCKVCRDNCCVLGKVNVTEEEYRKIYEYTGRGDYFLRNEDGVRQIDNEKGKYCRFFDKEKKLCSIQHIKPIECKSYPVYFGEKGSIKNFSIYTGCPAKSFLTEKYVLQAKKELEKIPKQDREKYYEITKKLGQL